MSTARRLVPGDSPQFRVVIGNLESTLNFKRAWDSHDDEALGALLGYPACCTVFFREVWSTQQCIDTTWAMAVNTVSAVRVDDYTLRVNEAFPSANLLWRWMGVRAVPHLPCSFDCEHTDTFAARLAQVGRAEGRTAELELIDEILRWPVEWTALHGIAEVKTPILRVATRTDSTAGKYTVRWEGKGYPEEGSSGVVFPYRMPSRILTKSVAFQRGNREALPLVTTSAPRWHHEDNGFSSLKAMRVHHLPVIKAAMDTLLGRGGNVIDLGCGNGTLVLEICKDRPELVPFGIDLEADKIAHAGILAGSNAGNFSLGNLFTLESWATREYVLAILMIGRLSEVPLESAKELLQALRESCEQVLLYVYPDWHEELPGDVLQRVGLKHDVAVDQLPMVVDLG